MYNSLKDLEKKAKNNTPKNTMVFSNASLLRFPFILSFLSSLSFSQSFFCCVTFLNIKKIYKL